MSTQKRVRFLLYFFFKRQHPWAEPKLFPALLFDFRSEFFSFFWPILTRKNRFHYTLRQVLILFLSRNPQPKQNRKYLHSVESKVDRLSNDHSSILISIIAHHVFNSTAVWIFYKPALKCPHRVRRCHRRVAILWSRPVQQLFHVEAKVFGQQSERLCRPLLEAQRTSVRSGAKLHADGDRIHNIGVCCAATGVFITDVLLKKK